MSGSIAAAQAVEHYEITRYGALIAWATELGRNDVVPLFKAKLAEEKATDQKLTADGGAPRQSESREQKSEQAKAVEAEESQLAARRQPRAAPPAAKAKRTGAEEDAPPGVIVFNGKPRRAC